MINAYEVVVPGADARATGNRKPPSIGYASFSPTFGEGAGRECAADSSATSCRGGLFWDGRATGAFIGAEVFAGNDELASAYGQFLGPAADQALAPFSNASEMNVPGGDDAGLPGAQFVCQHVAGAEYAALFAQAWGTAIRCDVGHVAISFKRIALAISAWEHSAEVNSFSSRRDRALAASRSAAESAQALSAQESLGRDLFYGLTTERNPSGKNAKCSTCHRSSAAGLQGDDPEEIYTDQRFHNIGVPPNYEAASFDPNAPDAGLSAHTDPEHVAGSPQAGAFRTPTLRNVDKRPWSGFIKAYMHNGYFKRLEDVVHFYNTAAIKQDPERCPPGTSARQARARDCWPAPELDTSIPRGLVGDLGLSADEEAAIVAYMRTLTDTDSVSPPGGFDSQAHSVHATAAAVGGRRPEPAPNDSSRALRRGGASSAQDQ